MAASVAPAQALVGARITVSVETATLAPLTLTAAIWKVYGVSCCSPPIVVKTSRVLFAHSAWCPVYMVVGMSGPLTTPPLMVYPTIGVPPTEAGGCQCRVTASWPGRTLTGVGAAGAVGNVNRRARMWRKVGSSPALARISSGTWSRLETMRLPATVALFDDESWSPCCQ